MQSREADAGHQSDKSTKSIPTDPNKIPPDPQPSRIKTLFRKLSGKTTKLPPTSVILTERNLTEYFNPEFNREVVIDEQHAYFKLQDQRKVSIPEWIRDLP
jgi:hypothetical protein